MTGKDFPMETSHVFRQRRRNGEEIATSGGGRLAGLPWLREASGARSHFSCASGSSE